MGAKKIKIESALDGQNLLSSEQICKILGIGNRKLRYMIASGELRPIIYIGRLIKMKPESLKAWINRRESGK